MRKKRSENQTSLFYGILIFNFVYLILASLLMYVFFLSSLNNFIHLKQEFDLKSEETQAIIDKLKNDLAKGNYINWFAYFLLN